MNYSVLQATESTPVALYLTGQLPEENRQGFYILLMWLNRQKLFIPKDLRKLLFEAIKIIRYNGCKIYKESEAFSNTTLQTDFLIMTAIDDNDASIGFNDQFVKIGHEPVFVYFRGLNYTIIQLRSSDFSIASYSINGDHDEVGGIQNVFNRLNSIPINQLLNNRLVIYDSGRLYLNYHEYLPKVNSSDLEIFIQMGFLQRGKPQ